MSARTSVPESDDYEEVVKKIDELRKDPKRFEEYMASRMVGDAGPGGEAGSGGRVPCAWLGRLDAQGG